ncbi:FCD domain-containing protein [Bradyrhizobium sp. CCGB12]|uniref:GntR family transcriptional regulator n=1 Tax=Bradyrhizobium sp. CCGB12 TaxID=2949632 RepID=UPI0020B21D1E|nr:FCD domain-containing protein [Bradyrhizobium sp. CCGB12]MCP3395149.1 FCD domain-containing protein [Bradyrhizobium sp. CCGB12]
MSLIEKEESAVGEDGYRRIRTDIIFGRLAPSHKLKLEALRETYAVSVSTLREVLSRLAAEGFVRAEGKRGFEVAAVSADNLRELAGLRLLLESHAMAVSFANADVEWEGRIVSAHHKLASTERLMDSGIGEPEQWKRYDGEFHQALISNCGSHLLMETHSLVFDKYFRYQMVAFHYRGAEPAAQHRALLECALKRDAETAKQVLSSHVNNCVAHALANSSLR